MRRLLMLAALFLVPVAGQAQTIEYYGLDAIGSVRVVFDRDGNVLSRADYAPFGEPLFPATGKQQQVYAGLFAEREAGFDYAEARMYQPRTGRFNTIDAVYVGLFQPQAWNRYAYALNSPALFVDTSGLNANECNVDICLEVRGSVYWSAWFSFWPIVPVIGGGGWSDVDFGGRGFWVPPTENPGTGDPTPPPTPTSPPPASPGAIDEARDLLRCASRQANWFSLAHVAGKVGLPENNFLIQTVLGNDIAGVSSFLADPSWGGVLDTPLPANLVGRVIVWSVTEYDDVFDLGQNGAGTHYAKSVSRKAVGYKNVIAEAGLSTLNVGSKFKLAWLPPPWRIRRVSSETRHDHTRAARRNPPTLLRRALEGRHHRRGPRRPP